jgi:glycosyltransferase involved in cell wall biosynthesis
LDGDGVGPGAIGGPLTVSVVIPTYNQAQSLRQTLGAVAAQTLAPLEVVVVDDGSTDSTPAVLDDVQRTYPLPLVVLRQANSGPGPARDRGWRTARGDLIAFTDSDAVPQPTWIEAALPHFRDPDIGAVEGRITCVTDRPPTIRTHQVQNLHGGHFLTANMIYRRSAIQAVGGIKTKHREDSDLAFSVLERGYRIVFAQDALVEHPPREESIRFQFRAATHRFYEGALFKRHPTIAPQYFRRLQPTGALVGAGDVLVLLGIFRFGWPAVSAGLLLLLLGLPRRVAVWLSGVAYSYRDYLTVLIVSLVLAPWETYHQWRGLLASPSPADREKPE